MSDGTSWGRDARPNEPGWWLASDGKWYPPETAQAIPDARAVRESDAVPTADAWSGTAPAEWWSTPADHEHTAVSPPVLQGTSHAVGPAALSAEDAARKHRNRAAWAMVAAAVIVVAVIAVVQSHSSSSDSSYVSPSDAAA